MIKAKPKRVNLSCTVPNDIANDLQKIADEEGHLMSRKICKVLTDYVKSNRKKPSIQDHHRHHDHLTQSIENPEKEK